MYEQHWWRGLISPVSSWVEWHWWMHGWLQWAGNIKPVSGLNNMKAALVGSEQAVGTCLRVHVHSWAMWLQLYLPWRKGKVMGQTGKKCAIFFSAFREALGQSRQTGIGSQLPCGVTVSARSFAPLLSSAGLWAFHSVAQVITCCYLAILLIKSVNFFCLLYDFWMLFIRRRWLDFLSLFASGWWWASYCTAKNCRLWTRSILLCVCASASLPTVPLLCFLWGFPASHQKKNRGGEICIERNMKPIN